MTKYFMPRTNVCVGYGDRPGNCRDDSFRGDDRRQVQLVGNSLDRGGHDLKVRLKIESTPREKMQEKHSMQKLLMRLSKFMPFTNIYNATIVFFTK